LTLTAVSVVMITQVDLGAAMAALTGANPLFLGVALVASIIGQTVSGGMWSVCQRAGGVRHVSLPTTLGIHWMARGACELLPANLGEAVRVGLVRRHPAGARAGSWRIAGGVASYKLIDAAVTGAVVLGIAIVAPLPGPAAGLRWMALGALAVVGTLFLVVKLGGAGRLLRFMPTRARSAAGRLGEGAGALGDAGAIRRAGVLGLVAIAMRLVSLMALLAALGLPPAAAGLAFSVIVLAGIVPAAPGGGGTREMVLLPALALAYGMSAGPALAFSLAVQAVALSTSLVMAGGALAWLGPRLTGWGSAPAPAPAIPAVAAALA
jgi:uncharacterized membrane protein YbhN (UPF0104 family)